ncbi:uncharacterized protein A1O5_10347 [Cladophialophora psammophila CBS 110553]|uniref:FAD-binding domain-containing protein n=1 Tax=Cladophialophora psammophila CBS 110553 TaxID=1182543 RepID=W9WPS0_9EURO|nr:uncharacterized protein A1O5_10347 [Cladophialophora psammophila CBS 110553]EXJ66676.1 hypothetical protein A1O5_10347 [Cladophialophora psammophila CBS 110553]
MQEVPILIIGAGPSGATTALLLAHMGIKSLAISRHASTASTPRAHIFNQRAMEVLRDADLEAKLMPASSVAHCKYMQHTSWLDSLNGEEYGRLWAWGNKPSQKGDYEAASPSVMSDLPQSVLEPVLVEEATKLGAEFRFSTSFVSLEETNEGVITTLRNRKDNREYKVFSQWMVGADGARSAVLDSLGIKVLGRQLNTAFNTHIKADLTKFISHRPGSLNWVLNTEAPEWSAVGNFRMVRPWTEFVVSMHPSTKVSPTFQPSEEDIIKRLHQMIGDDTVKIDVLSIFSWTINDQVAERWQKGRVLCIGDATHRHPPINGLGSNTCISDAFNLAWKLAYVLKGWASTSLLETLTIERKPVGDGIVRRANSGMEAHRRLWDLLGLDPEARKKATDLMHSSTAAGAEMREKVRNALEATEDEVQALGIQMNQRYLSSPATVVEPDDTPPDLSSLNPIRQVWISTFPGYHLPHVWLAPNSRSERISTLDLSGHGGFTLFTGIGGEPWVQAAQIIFASKKVPVRDYTIGFRCDYIDCYQD